MEMVYYEWLLHHFTVDGTDKCFTVDGASVLPWMVAQYFNGDGITFFYCKLVKQCFTGDGTAVFHWGW